MTRDSFEKITELRHILHRRPDLSLCEEETMEIVRAFLSEHTSFEMVARDGWFYAFKQGDDDQNPIAFRADMDALPMDEGIDLPYASRKKGAAHKCGHDGHMAALCGLALELDRRELKRSVYLIFQPAEEIGKGAAVCSEMIREKGIAEIYAFHNLSGYPEGSIVFRRGLTQPASEGLMMRFAGAPSHASNPEEGLSPAEAIARTALFAHRLPEDYPGERAWCTIVGMHCGESDFGIYPGTGSLAVTLRAEQEAVMKEMEGALIRFAREAAQGLQVECEIRDYFPETRNHDAALNRVLRIAEEMRIPAVEMSELWRASEDFGHYLKECPGAIFYIGNGEDHPPLHTQDYDFNDRILPIAVDIFAGLALME